MTEPFQHDKATQELLNKLHARLAEALLERIESGEAKAADLAAAVRFLADNGVRNIPTGDDSGLQDELKKLLPFTPAEELLEAQHLGGHG